jgi:hypothetical protein
LAIGAEDDLHVDVDGREDRGERARHGVRQAATDSTREDLHQVAEGAHRVEQCPDQHAESDEQADLGHDLAEPAGDLRDGAVGAQSGGEPEVHTRQQQGDDGVDLEPDDEQDRGQDRDGGVHDFHGAIPICAAKCVAIYCAHRTQRGRRGRQEPTSARAAHSHSSGVRKDPG